MSHPEVVLSFRNPVSWVSRLTDGQTGSEGRSDGAVRGKDGVTAPALLGPQRAWKEASWADPPQTRGSYISVGPGGPGSEGHAGGRAWGFSTKQAPCAPTPLLTGPELRARPCLRIDLCCSGKRREWLWTREQCVPPKRACPAGQPVGLVVERQ